MVRALSPSPETSRLRLRLRPPTTMDEKEFRGMLDLFPVVRSRDYCVILLLLQPATPLLFRLPVPLSPGF